MVYVRNRINPFMPTAPTFVVRETDVSRHNGGTSGAPLKRLRDDSALKALSYLRGWAKMGNGGQKWVKSKKYCLSHLDDVLDLPGTELRLVSLLVDLLVDSVADHLQNFFRNLLNFIHQTAAQFAHYQILENNQIFSNNLKKISL